MQTHTVPWLCADVSLATAHPHLAPDHQLHLCFLLLSVYWLIVTFYLFIYLFHNCNRFVCNNVNNKQQNTKPDGQQYGACVTSLAVSLDQLYLSATWLTNLDEHTESGYHRTRMRHWHRDKFPASWKHAKHWPGIISEYALPFLSQFTLNDLETCWCSSLRRITIISTYSPVEKEQLFPCLVLQLFVCNTGNEPIRQ